MELEHPVVSTTIEMRAVCSRAKIRKVSFNLAVAHEPFCVTARHYVYRGCRSARYCYGICLSLGSKTLLIHKKWPPAFCHTVVRRRWGPFRSDDMGEPMRRRRCQVLDIEATRMELVRRAATGTDGLASLNPLCGGDCTPQSGVPSHLYVGL